MFCKPLQRICFRQEWTFSEFGRLWHLICDILILVFDLRFYASYFVTQYPTDVLYTNLKRNFCAAINYRWDMHAIDPTIQFLTKLPAHSIFSKVSITTALYCHPSTYRLFFCKSALMGHAIVGRSIIPPVNPLSVHKLANESPLAPEPPAPLCPHQRR